MTAERYGIYFAPPVTGELWRRAAIWLGRDAATDVILEADIGGVDPEHRHKLTHSGRRYGFHATLKPPMGLNAKLEGKDLDRALKAWTVANGAVDIGPLALQPIEGFLALVPAAQPQALTDFAARVVADFDDFRAPLTELERRRRVASGQLSARQIELLDRFGYPYVAEEFRFHMTLTDSLGAADQAAMASAAADWFAPFIGEHLLLDRLVLFHEAEPGAPFRRLRDYPLTGDA